MDTSPAGNAFSITPGSSLLTHQTRGIYVGTGGDVEVVTANGQTVVFVGALGGSIIPVFADKVLSGNTTATDLVGMY